jgi:alkylation response protein AidB-like acyl-CoA dehydrogenase
MTATTTTKTRAPSAPAADIDWAARARALTATIAAASDRIEKERQVTADIMAALHEARLFHMLLPRELGGGEADPIAFMEVIEAVSAGDASVGWCLGQGLGCTHAAGFLKPEIAKEIFGPANGVLAWGPPSGAKAIKVEGGYRVSGRWRFASGSPHATWLGGHSIVCEADGTPVKDAKGRPVLRTMLFPKAKCTIHDVWNVLGLRGTGSNDYEVKDLFVPAAYTTWRDSVPDRSHDAPLYNVPLLTLYGMGFAGVGLGIAKACLAAFMELASKKVTSGRTAPLAENAVVQSEVAQATWRLEAARSYLIDRLEEYWEVVKTTADVPLDVRARLRIAITSAMHRAREVVDYTFTAAGTNAIFEGSPFERRFRDIHTVTAQGQAHAANFEFSGQALFGYAPAHRL